MAGFADSRTGCGGRMRVGAGALIIDDADAVLQQGQPSPSRSAPRRWLIHREEPARGRCNVFAGEVGTSPISATGQSIAVRLASGSIVRVSRANNIPFRGKSDRMGGAGLLTWRPTRQSCWRNRR